MSERDKIIMELQMLTGVVTNDIDYLYYLLIKNGTYFKRDKVENPYSELSVDDLETLLNKI